ncbi:POU domain, class 6, transcription factor 1 isoform X2 [Brienomyrus brachyistius]|uniref:POU domain, class 6, transcription factor 1 isoform X2 n=1 Tax=Brienomyrus brachyistius TaxID=42636 RepID=UPI0020B2F245|nr:POU domain, class 6, transcription factor 1 isoform X2 [Brienomyrus brachyistius]XP_048873205.1 POU domain, class 6, transcription factor 1 isoform X2 [Brienomyrus brachyistius]XP_048873206.1 POU domain, class 6, transcription factor 1 isoform X2 [Brienomyrus brachyistius]XP_048873207.1 POU domain, class 6, transcription factor 1 isoform X2 [Brienomyrus brachyistius]
MESEELGAQDAPLTVNEQTLGSCTLKFPARDNQVIVMSGHETIRVLEVEVDAGLPASGPGTKVDAEADGAGRLALEAVEVGVQDAPVPPCSTGGAVLGDGGPSVEVAAPTVQTAAHPCPLSMALSQPQAAVPVTVQACPPMLTQDSLTTLMTGMVAHQPGSLGQPLLIPISVAGSVGGQGGLAVLTFPTATVTTLPGLTAATPAGGVLKLPLAGLQAATVLNTVQPQLHAAAQTVLQPQAGAAALQSVQAALQQPQTTQAAAQVAVASSAAAAAPRVSEASVSMAALQNAGISLNPAIISAASLGAQPQFISSLTTTPVITSAISGMAGLTSQIITNAQGQVIGALPLLVNPASLTGGAAASPLQAQGLQVQTMSPQLVLNAQGQIIATIGNGPVCTPTSASVIPKPSVPLSLSKSTSQGQVVTVTQAPVVIAPQPSIVKNVAPLSSPAPVTCSDSPTVGQLVNKPQPGAPDEEGINLEEIREFAKNFKIRRLSLGLTQTQVGQALTATEGPAYSQSAICRFEKLDITPKSAQKLKPVLEKWLAEAELWNQKGQQNLMEFVGGEPSKKRKRRTSFTPQAIEVLNTYFEKNALPTGQEITEIAKELNYDREVVRVWFCNRRQTLKNTSKINVFQVQ